MASDVGLFECGLPSTRRAQQLGVGVDLAGRVQAAAGVVEVHVVRRRRGGRTRCAAARRTCRRDRTRGTRDVELGLGRRRGRRARARRVDAAPSRQPGRRRRRSAPLRAGVEHRAGEQVGLHRVLRPVRRQRGDLRSSVGVTSTVKHVARGRRRGDAVAGRRRCRRAAATAAPRPGPAHAARRRSARARGTSRRRGR